MGWAILDGLDEDDRRDVLRIAVRRRFASGDTIFHQGDPGSSVHLIDTGHVAIRAVDLGGTTLTLDVLAPGASFGELGLVDDASVRSASAVAVGAVETRVIGRDAFEDLRQRHPIVTTVLVQLLAARVRALSEQLLDSYTLAAEERVLKALHRLATSFGPVGGAAGAVTVPVTQEELASIAGSTRPTTNRALRPLVDAGIVSLGRGRIVIHEVALLGARP